ncbi:MAG: ComEA family DNA-binding protein [Gammaproteobacteria bacterium]|nr:ComEA family DNA-binding protein [Gammaproteobacteria bacterium]NNF61907.1 ComEA family DNA-binding protein [Gammaproteobacteria bacterium]NNM19789.1 ComEA family DNA-binding protein [Gammaproteobacteria bacterium]
MKWILWLCLLACTGIAGAGPVNINKADAETLAQELNGVGHSRAQAIVAWREKNGPFRSVDELQNVKGIGSRVLQKNRGDILLADPRAEAD